MTFVSLVVALLLDRARPLPDSSVALEWFRRYADRLAHDLNAGKPVHGTVAWLAAVCPWVLGVLIAFYLFHYINPVLGWLGSLACGAILLALVAVLVRVGLGRMQRRLLVEAAKRHEQRRPPVPPR